MHKGSRLYPRGLSDCSHQSVEADGDVVKFDFRVILEQVKKRIPKRGVRRFFLQ